MESNVQFIHQELLIHQHASFQSLEQILIDHIPSQACPGKLYFSTIFKKATVRPLIDIN